MRAKNTITGIPRYYQEMSEQTHLCYYSNRCKWSKAFISELSQTPWKGMFRYICVDPAPGRPALPAWLKKVPTIVVPGEGEPRTDSDVMNWLYEKKMKDGGGGSSNQQGHQGPSPNSSNDPDAYSFMEQSSFSKGFSYSGVNADTSTQGDGGISMPGAFSFLNGSAGVGDKTQNTFSETINATNRRSKKEELFDKQMEAYQRERETGLPRAPARS